MKRGIGCFGIILILIMASTIGTFTGGDISNKVGESESSSTHSNAKKLDINFDDYEGAFCIRSKRDAAYWLVDSKNGLLIDCSRRSERYHETKDIGSLADGLHFLYEDGSISEKYYIQKFERSLTRVFFCDKNGEILREYSTCSTQEVVSRLNRIGYYTITQ